ncbi:MAG: PQQ-like beta-propeller repeat protein [Bryobacterales bacterium]|nr:PQQ-like beta-propeller repeat protein [Bryobacterales bacterium]
MKRVTLLFLPALALAFGVDDWPRWRGPLNNGVARGDVPAEFGPEKNIAWKLDLPGRGFSSPVLWGDKIFLTNAVPTGKDAPPAAEEGGAGGGARRGAGGGAAKGREHKFVLMAVDARTGKVIWERVAKTATPHEGYHGRYGSFASNSPVTDGKHVLAFFGSRGLYCYDLDGKLIWEKQFSPMHMRLEFGEGSAAVLHGNTVLLNFDQESGSFILALDKNTGKERWRKERTEASSWAPPFVVKAAGRDQVILPASAKVRSYDFHTGELIWECAGLGSNVIPSPVTVDDQYVIVMSGHREPNLLAIRLDSKGDVTGSDKVMWTNQRGNSYTPSPVLHDGKLYMLTDNGMLSCLDAATGKPYYAQQRLPNPSNYKASPVAVNGKLYLSSENGDVLVLRLGEKFDVVAVNSFGPDHMFIASPAVSGGSLYLRSSAALFCIRSR